MLRISYGVRVIHQVAKDLLGKRGRRTNANVCSDYYFQWTLTCNCDGNPQQFTLILIFHKLGVAPNPLFTF